MRNLKAYFPGSIRSVLITAVILTMVAVGVVSAQSPGIDGSDPTPTPVSAAPTPAPAPVNAAVADSVLALSKVITYQGRLTTPSTGVNKPDGSYEMSFRLFNHATASAQSNLVWGPETQNIAVSKGLFSAALGSVTPFGASVFNGQDLWLGVTVGTDPELTPRTRVSAVAYALYADNADRLDGIDSTTFATEAEVMPIVTSNGGDGSGINADYLDGLSSGDFARNLGYAAAWTNVCLNAGSSTGYYHWQVASADDVRIWKIRPYTDNTHFRIMNFAFRRHFGNYAYHFYIYNPSTGDGGSGVNGCFDIMYYRLQ